MYAPMAGLELMVSSSTSTPLVSNWWEYVLLFLAVIGLLGRCACYRHHRNWGSSGRGEPGQPQSDSSHRHRNRRRRGWRVDRLLRGDAVGKRSPGTAGEAPGGTPEADGQGRARYEKWGRMAVFFTPAIVSGTARMKRSQFIVWNFIAALAFTWSVAATAYGAGRVTTGHHSSEDILILVLGLASAAILTGVLVRRHRRHRSPRSIGT